MSTIESTETVSAPELESLLYSVNCPVCWNYGFLHRRVDFSLLSEKSIIMENFRYPELTFSGTYAPWIALQRGAHPKRQRQCRYTSRIMREITLEQLNNYVTGNVRVSSHHF